MSKSIFITVIAATLLPLTAGASVFAATTEQFTSEANKATYWGTSCVKFEKFNDKTYTYTAAASDVSKVIIKAGTQNTIYTDTFVNIGAANGKAISHVIVCTDAVAVPPTNPTTPTLPETPVTPETPAHPQHPCQTGETPSGVALPDVACGGVGSGAEHEDKNQSACNPSDTNSANPKHHNDGVDCEEVVDEQDSDGHILDEAASTTVAAVQGVTTTTLPAVLPSTGSSSVNGFVVALLAGLSAYGVALRRGLHL